MTADRNLIVAAALAAALLAGAVTAAQAGPIADLVAYCEIGQNATGGLTWMDPDNVLGRDNAGLSLGNWTDATGLSSVVEDLTGYNMDQGHPTGLVLGFSNPVANGPGNDLRIMGNAMGIEGTEYYWSEPGYIEVAMETTAGQTGATVDGWTDETFYLIKPSNYDIVGDPRNGPLSNILVYGDDPTGAVDEYGDPIQVQYYAGSWGEDLIHAGGSQLDLYGYADWNPAGDEVNLDDAIDAAGQFVDLEEIAYVRIRTVSDDLTGLFGSMSTEVTYIEDISVVPEPTTLALLALGALAVRRRRVR